MKSFLGRKCTLQWPHTVWSSVYDLQGRLMNSCDMHLSRSECDWLGTHPAADCLLWPPGLAPEILSDWVSFWRKKHFLHSCHLFAAWNVNSQQDVTTEGKKCLKKKRLVDGDMQAWSLVKKGLNCWKIATQAFSSWKEIASNDVNLILICKFLFSDKENGPRWIGWLHFQIFYLYCRDLFSLDWYHTSEPGPRKGEQSHRQCAVRLSTISWTQHMQHTCAWKVSSHQELWADCSA